MIKNIFDWTEKHIIKIIRKWKTWKSSLFRTSLVINEDCDGGIHCWIIPIKYLKCSLHFMLIIYLLPIWSMNIFSCIKSFHVGHHLDVIVVNVWWAWYLASLNSVRKTKSNGGFLKNAYFIKKILKDVVHIKENINVRRNIFFAWWLQLTRYLYPNVN